ncbi:hypothetical protein GCM10028809_22060 [Spirosoma gilvum]
MFLTHAYRNEPGLGAIHESNVDRRLCAGLAKSVQRFTIYRQTVNTLFINRLQQNTSILFANMLQ